MHIIDDRMQLQPWGVRGGLAGRDTEYVLNPGRPDKIRFDRKIDAHQLRAGDRLSAKPPGGGGGGDPLSRDPSAVLKDIADGLVSRASAIDDYGIAFDGAGAFDDAAALACRAELKKERRRFVFFDRGDRFRARQAAGKITMTTEDVPVDKVA